jgi:glutaminase
MYELNGIVYADDPTPLKTIKYVRPLDNYKLLVRFSTEEEKEADISEILNEPAFKPLKDKNVFQGAYIDYGTVVWCNGTIDIAPEYLYNIGLPPK